jgi:hypothetical protein
VKHLAGALILGLSFAATTALAAEEGTKAPDTDDAEKATHAEDQANLKTQKAEDTSPQPKPEGDENATPKPEDKENGEEDTFGHGMQVGLRAGFAFGFKMYFRYDRSPLCQKYDPSKAPNDQIKSCGFAASPATEVALSFAPFDSVEPYIFMRLGLSGESRTNTKPLQLFGVGARIYTMSDSRLKIFLEPALAYETEGGAGNPDWAPPPGATGTTSGGKPQDLTPQYKKDLIFHLGIGPQYDFAKAFGIFLNGGVDVGVLRAISANLHVNIGAQVRFP